MKGFQTMLMELIGLRRRGNWAPLLMNTIGEMEQDRKSRRENLVEAFGMMVLVLVLLWLLGYTFGVLMGVEIANKIAMVIIWIASLYILFVSSHVHGDKLSTWGLGSPWTVIRMLREGNWPTRIGLGGFLTFFTIFMAYMFFIFWPEAAKFLFGVKREAAEAFKATAGGKVGVVVMGALISLFFSTVIIRYDNFFSAFYSALKILAVLAPPLYIGALLYIGPEAFAEFDPLKFALGVFGYLFWGVVQQLLFSSYFGTRIRKGFGPAKNPKNQFWWRLFVAFINGSFFGFIHIQSWYLVAVTWFLGIFLSWVFMADRSRNLVALGFVHGFLGSSLGWLFSSGKAGGLEVNMNVGPWHVHGFDPTVPIVVIPVTLIYIGFIIYALRMREA
jgi:hypothetical protein